MLLKITQKIIRENVFEKKKKETRAKFYPRVQSWSVFEQLGPGVHPDAVKQPSAFATLETKRKLGLVNVCKDFWDCYLGQGKIIGQ